MSLFVSFATIEGGEGGSYFIKERAGIVKIEIRRVCIIRNMQKCLLPKAGSLVSSGPKIN